MFQLWKRNIFSVSIPIVQMKMYRKQFEGQYFKPKSESDLYFEKMYYNGAGNEAFLSK